MATGGESSDKDDELIKLDREISELRAAKKESFERTRSVDDELQRIAHRERECIDERNRLRAEQHDRVQHQQLVQHVSELEAKLQQAKLENRQLSDRNEKLKQSLDQTVKLTKKQRQKITEQEGKTAYVPAQVQSKSEDSVAVVELQKQLSYTTKQWSETKVELNKMRQRLSDVQDRLTRAEQVTEATQQRQLQESKNSQQLKQELHVAPQHQ